MKCIIPGPNVKVFGKAVHSLSKIGEELYLEPLPNGLSLRTVNSCRSAFACFIFAPAFFMQYSDDVSAPHERVTDESSNESEPEPQLKCKIGMKSVLSVFRSLSTLDKTVDRCKIRLDLEACRLVFQLYCRHGIVKTHNLAFIECETLQAVYSKDMSPNVLTAQSRLLADVVVNFQTTQDEISLIVNPEKVTFKNYVEDEADSSKVIHTQLSLDPAEFENFQVGIDTEITFCLKELRAILAFSEGANLPLSIRFETPGKPVVFGLDSDPSFEANYVLASMADPSTSQMSCSQQPASRCSTTARVKRTESRLKPGTSASDSYFPTPKATPAPRMTPAHSSVTPGLSRQLAPRNTIESARKKSESAPAKKTAEAFQQMLDDEDMIDEDLLPQPMAARSANNPAGDGNKSNKSETCIAKPAASNQRTNTTSAGDVLPKVNVVNDRNKLNGYTAENASNEGAPPSPPRDSTSPVIPVQCQSKQHVKNLLLPLSPKKEQGSEDEEEEDMVPGTPPSKKMRLSFFGLSQSTTSGTQDTRPSQILAEDTDEED